MRREPIIFVAAMFCLLIVAGAQAPVNWKKDHIYANGQLAGIVSPGDFSLSVTPGSLSIEQGQSASYAVTIAGIAGFSSRVTLSLTSSLPLGATSSFSPTVISPGQSSTLTISTAITTPSGGPTTLTITGISGNQVKTGSTTITITPRQPTSLSFSPVSIFAGNGALDGGCTTITVGNGREMTVELRWMRTPWGGGSAIADTSPIGPFDVNGQMLHCPPQNGELGDYSYTEIKNTLRADWIPLSPPPQLRVRPPRPTSFKFNPSSVPSDQIFTVTVGNGANQTLVEEVRLPDTTTISLNFSLGADGTANNGPHCGLDPGDYVVLRVRNQLDSAADAWYTPSTLRMDVFTLAVTRGDRCPFSLGFSPSDFIADGTSLTTVTVGMGAPTGQNVVVSTLYTPVNGLPVERDLTFGPLNGGGQVPFTPALSDAGTYDCTGIRNADPQLPGSFSFPQPRPQLVLRRPP